MMKRMGLMVMVALALLVGPVSAQEPTAEAPVEVVTDVPEEVVIPPVEIPAEQPGGTVSNLLTFFGGAVTGVLATLGAVLGLVGQLKNNKPALDAIEWLGRSIPADTLEKLNDLARNLKDAADVLADVTDGQENIIAAQAVTTRALSDAPRSAFDDR